MSPRQTTDRIPVTVVSGYLGAGKTTLVNHVLNNRRGLEVAVVVNDMGAVNVDADLIAGDGLDDESNVVDLSNGCICCRLQGDLLTEVERLAERWSFDYLLVEASGISEPIPVARAFTVGAEESDVDPTDRYRLDTMVSVVDAYGFWKEFDPDADRPGAEPERPLADVLVDQAEFCDVLLLNKCDMVPEDALDDVEALLRELQPRAPIHRTTYARVDPETILGTGRFDFETASRTAGWKRKLAAHGGHEDGERGRNGHDHDSIAERHGVSSFVYAETRPFHPERLRTWLDDWDGDVVRAKGFFRLAGRADVMGLSQAGPSVQAGPIGEWSPEDDPETKLVFIGRNLDETRIRRELDGCLATDEECERGAYADPFPAT